MCQRPFLSPSGQSAIDQGRIARLHLFRTKSQLFHFARPEPFDQHLGTFDQLPEPVDISGLCQVKCQAAARAVEQIVFRINRQRKFLTGPRDAHHFSAQISQMHRSKRRRAKTCHFNNAYTFEGT